MQVTKKYEARADADLQSVSTWITLLICTCQIINFEMTVMPSWWYDELFCLQRLMWLVSWYKKSHHRILYQSMVMCVVGDSTAWMDHAPQSIASLPNFQTTRLLMTWLSCLISSCRPFCRWRQFRTLQDVSTWFASVDIYHGHGYKQEGLISPFVLTVNVARHLTMALLLLPTGRNADHITAHPWKRLGVNECP